MFKKLKNWMHGELVASKRVEMMKLVDWFAEHASNEHPGLNRWDDSLPIEKQKFIKLKRIEVETEEDKAQLLAASRYIHDLYEIDTGYLAVNHIAHLYTDPDVIVVTGVDSPPSKL